MAILNLKVYFETEVLGTCDCIFMDTADLLTNFF
jgi:hypothetical protein